MFEAIQSNSKDMFKVANRQKRPQKVQRCSKQFKAILKICSKQPIDIIDNKKFIHLNITKNYQFKAVQRDTIARIIRFNKAVNT